MDIKGLSKIESEYFWRGFGKVVSEKRIFRNPPIRSNKVLQVLGQRTSAHRED
jgi:hypothetical protein